MAPRADSQGGETSCGVGGVLCGTEGIGLSRLHGLGSKWGWDSKEIWRMGDSFRECKAG